MIWSVAWRNIWRNKLRSGVIIGGLTIGVFAGVFMWAFYSGMVNQRIDTAIKTESSNIQLHNAKYLEDPDVKYNIDSVKEKIQAISKLQGVKAVTYRTIMNSMVMSAETGSGVRIMGIDPDMEKNVTNLYQKVIEGTYFVGMKRNPILIGSNLAEKLNVKLRSKVVVTVQQSDGTITKAQFRVVGIFKTSNSIFDETNVFVRNSDLESMADLGVNKANEIAVLLNDNSQLDAEEAKIQAMYPNLDVKTWRQLMPEVSLIEKSMDFSMYLVMGIVLLGLLFAIVNTMLMAVLERIKELGMLMAVGMNKMRVFTMIVLETLLLSVTGGMVGIVIGALSTWITYHTGVSLAAWGKAYESMGFETIVYPEISTAIVIKITVMVVITGILAALYPAYKALQFKPAEALRIDV